MCCRYFVGFPSKVYNTVTPFLFKMTFSLSVHLRKFVIKTYLYRVQYGKDAPLCDISQSNFKKLVVLFTERSSKDRALDRKMEALDLSPQLDKFLCSQVQQK